MRTRNSSSHSLRNVRLPEEVITEILVCLPVKSLMKFKCVSKSWLSSISTPQFIRSHLSKSCKEYLNHQLLYSTTDPNPSVKVFSLYSALQQPPTHVVSDIEYPFKNHVDPPKIIGIINGLVCFVTKAANLFLWNPVLRKVKQLPSSNMDSGRPFRTLSFGFGYDESNDDYKVFSLLNLTASLTEIWVYSRRTDSWRRMEDWRSYAPSLGSGVYASGKMYWSVCRPDSPTPFRKIVSLDMSSERYEELEMPDCEAGGRQWKFGVLGGRPYVVRQYYKKAREDLWLLDKHGVEECWRKVGFIAYDDVH